MIKNLKPTLAILTLLLFAFNFNTTAINRESDKEYAKIIGDKYYYSLKDTDYNAACKLLSNDFWKVTPRDKTLELYRNVNRKLGKLKTITLDHWETRVVKGTSPSSEYVLYYLNQYEKYEAKETLRLLKEGDQIKIVAFNVNSEGLLK